MYVEAVQGGRVRYGRDVPQDACRLCKARGCRPCRDGAPRHPVRRSGLPREGEASQGSDPRLDGGERKIRRMASGVQGDRRARLQGRMRICRRGRAVPRSRGGSRRDRGDGPPYRDTHPRMPRIRQKGAWSVVRKVRRGDGPRLLVLRRCQAVSDRHEAVRLRAWRGALRDPLCGRQSHGLDVGTRCRRGLRRSAHGFLHEERLDLRRSRDDRHRQRRRRRRSAEESPITISGASPCPRHPGIPGARTALSRPSAPSRTWFSSPSW